VGRIDTSRRLAAAQQRGQGRGKQRGKQRGQKPRLSVGYLPKGRFHDAVLPANEGFNTFTPSDPLEYIPPVAQRHGNEAVSFRRGGPYLRIVPDELDDLAELDADVDDEEAITAIAEGNKEYRYVYDDESGLVVRFEHSVSPQIEKIIEDARRPAKFAALGAVAGIIIGAIIVGLVIANALGVTEEK
jgi:hypothetical protein